MTDPTIINQILNILLAVFALLSALAIGTMIALFCKFYLFK